MSVLNCIISTGEEWSAEQFSTMMLIAIVLWIFLKSPQRLVKLSALIIKNFTSCISTNSYSNTKEEKK